MKKYAIFNIQGGIGKHIAATAVAKCIKNNFPDRELIVVCAWPSPFINLDFVDRVYKEGMTPYFYQDYDIIIVIKMVLDISYNISTYL